MLKKAVFTILFYTVLSTVSVCSGMEVSSEDMNLSKQWFSRHFESGSDMPFAFDYGDMKSKDILSKWQFDKSQSDSNDRILLCFKWLDPNGVLGIRCECVVYKSFPVVEWTVYFENKGRQNSLMLSQIHAINSIFTRAAENSEFVLHKWKGGSAFKDDYEPSASPLSANSQTDIACFGGRPTNENMCYFNLEMPGPTKTDVVSATAIWQKTRTLTESGGGVIIALGWPGQWKMSFVRDGLNSVAVIGGQEKTEFYLRPSERARSPLVALQFYKGGFIRSQNIWRKWMLNGNLPKIGNSVPVSLLTPCSSHQFVEATQATEKNQIEFIKGYIEKGLKPDFWWIDAGWYKLYKDNWVSTGTWQIDPIRFPNGFKPISDYAHKNNVKLLVWFEPERVTDHTWLWENRQSWLLSPKDVPDRVGWMKEWKLLNLGNTQARQWLTEHISLLFQDNSIDLYRQDFNIDPLFFWNGGDEPNRIGITENLYVQGYLAYFDELRKRISMPIDSCASGGRRNDLETMRRALPFIRSDYVFEPIGQQGHMYGISMLLPYNGTGPSPLDVSMYNLRSTMCPHQITCFDVRDPNVNWKLIRQWHDQWRELSLYYQGDYYPLTEYTLSEQAVIAWQFDCPEQKRGMVQAFRRPECPVERCRFIINGIDADQTYEIRDVDANAPFTRSGAELIKSGLPVVFNSKPAASIVTYKVVKQKNK